MFLSCKEQVLDDKIVRRYVLGILVSEYDIFVVIDHEVHTEELLTFCLYFLFSEISAY